MDLNIKECIALYAIGSYGTNNIGIQPLHRRITNRFLKNNINSSEVVKTLGHLISKELIINKNHYSLEPQGQFLFDK